MRRLRNIALLLVAFFTTLIVSLGVIYKIGISSVDKNDDKIILVEIKKGMTTTDIAKVLKENDLIKNEIMFKVYAKLNGVNSLKSGYFELSKNMDLEAITTKIQEGDTVDPNSIIVLFKEGLNMRGIANVIEKNTNNNADSVFALLEDETYINEVIEKYWFLEDDIKDVNIYYPLEGYLFPNTYTLRDKDVTVKEIFEIMLNETDKILSKYKDEIVASKYNVHELLTIASMAELEGVSLDDRKNICGVFYNRLDKKMSLGSDVTTYYAFKVDMSERDLTKKEINTYNAFNTRGPNMSGKIPVGPVANPSKEAIEAAIIPAINDYLYFVADKNRKVYFTKTDSEHNAKVKELKNKGLWIEW
ncbi:MAG: endolytic transglycosylase MltG [Bacilli bacterium]|nr:endolytic transglycosylase MltG [Bacilli bacterium]